MPTATRVAVTEPEVSVPKTATCSPTVTEAMVGELTARVEVGGRAVDLDCHRAAVLCGDGEEPSPTDLTVPTADRPRTIEGPLTGLGGRCRRTGRRRWRCRRARHRAAAEDQSQRDGGCARHLYSPATPLTDGRKRIGSRTALGSSA